MAADLIFKPGDKVECTLSHDEQNARRRQDTAKAQKGELGWKPNANPDLGYRLEWTHSYWLVEAVGQGRYLGRVEAREELQWRAVTYHLPGIDSVHGDNPKAVREDFTTLEEAAKWVWLQWRTE
jgi:hypothetical protein